MSAKRAMDRVLTLVLAVAVTACAAAGTENGDIELPAGTVLSTTLDQEIDIQDAREGDRVSATVSEPVYEEGQLAIPAGARITGSVTAVQRAGETSETDVDVVKLDFTEIRYSGQDYPLEATVIEANPQLRSETSTGEAIAKIAGGTAAGAILGRIIGGDDEGTLVGAAVGAAAGTAIVLGTQQKKAVLPKGSKLRLRTAEKMEVMALNTSR